VDRFVIRDDRFANHLPNEAWLSPDGLPANRPSTLISSSSSSQWMPTPRPIRRQRFRSDDDACDKRGYHASGTEMLRPSLRSTQSVSSETATFSTKGILISMAVDSVIAYGGSRFKVRFKVILWPLLTVPDVPKVQPLRSVQSLAAVQSSRFKSSRKEQLGRNFRVSGIDRKRIAAVTWSRATMMD
jgi:hypothetical protein